MEKRTLTQHLGAFGGATFISRILGYIRDALVAAYFGGGLLTDAFYAAFKVPNLLRRFLGEGAMTAAFVPIFTDLNNKKGKKDAVEFFNALFSGLVVVLTTLVVLGVIFAPAITKAVAWGFTQTPEKFELAKELVRITFPFLFFISLAALMTAVLNSSGRFFVPAVSPAGLSIAEIAFVLLFYHSMSSPIHGLAASVVAGGALHFMFQLPKAWKLGFRPRLVKPFSHPEVKTFLILLGPTILGLCAEQVNAFVDQFCASFLIDGSITALYNSDRVMQLPLALFGIAMSNVALPALSKAVSNQNRGEFKDILNFSLGVTNYVLIPSFIGFVILGLPIIQLLFEHGRFTQHNSILTYQALVPYALGLPAYSAVKIMATAFYAQKNTKTPVRVALYAMGLHAVLSVTLMWRFQVAGLALSTALSSWFQCVCLFYLLRKEVGNLGGRGLLKSFFFGTGVGILMGAVCYISYHYYLSSLSLYLRVPFVILVGVVVYFGLSKLFRIHEFEVLLNSLLKKRV